MSGIKNENGINANKLPYIFSKNALYVTNPLLYPLINSFIVWNGTILNDVLKSSSSVSGILKLFFKEIKISYAIPIVGYIVSSTVFGELNVKSLKNKINIIIDEIDGSLSSKEKEEKIAEQLVNNFNILKNDYLKEFSKDGNNYDVEISGLDNSGDWTQSP